MIGVFDIKIYSMGKNNKNVNSWPMSSNFDFNSKIFRDPILMYIVDNKCTFWGVLLKKSLPAKYSEKIENWMLTKWFLQML